MTTPTTPSYELDLRGIVSPCPHCGRRNRLLYERIGSKFRCSECHTELTAPAVPIDVPGPAEFQAVVAKSAVPVLVDFWAPWCGPCKMVAPELVKVAATGAGQWLVVKVNTEDRPELGAQFNVRAIPTMVLFRHGAEVARQAGALPAAGILRFIEGAPNR
jgi:thioredoxin 2